MTRAAHVPVETRLQAAFETRSIQNEKEKKNSTQTLSIFNGKPCLAVRTLPERRVADRQLPCVCFLHSDTCGDVAAKDNVSRRGHTQRLYPSARGWGPMSPTAAFYVPDHAHDIAISGTKPSALGDIEI